MIRKIATARGRSGVAADQAEPQQPDDDPAIERERRATPGLFDDATRNEPLDPVGRWRRIISRSARDARKQLQVAPIESVLTHLAPRRRHRPF